MLAGDKQRTNESGVVWSVVLCVGHVFLCGKLVSACFHLPNEVWEKVSPDNVVRVLSLIFRTNLLKYINHRTRLVVNDGIS